MGVRTHTRRIKRPDRTERGSMLPLLVLGLLIGAGGTLLLGRLGQAAVSRATARTAADAAALAGAAEGEGAAREVAAANGATVLRFEVLGEDTRVTVQVREAEAVGRARRGRPGSEARSSPRSP